MELIKTFAAEVEGEIRILAIAEMYILTNADLGKRTVFYSVDDRWYQTQTPSNATVTDIITWCKSKFRYDQGIVVDVKEAMETLSLEFCGHKKLVRHEMGDVLTVRQVHHMDHWVRINDNLVNHISGVRYRGFAYPTELDWVYNDAWITRPGPVGKNMRTVALEHFGTPDIMTLAKSYFYKKEVLC